MFTRMPNFYINDCKELEFDAAIFGYGGANQQKTEHVEGAVTWTQYWYNNWQESHEYRRRFFIIYYVLVFGGYMLYFFSGKTCP